MSEVTWIDKQPSLNKFFISALTKPRWVSCYGTALEAEDNDDDGDGGDRKNCARMPNETELLLFFITLFFMLCPFFSCHASSSLVYM